MKETSIRLCRVAREGFPEALEASWLEESRRGAEENHSRAALLNADPQEDGASNLGRPPP